MRMKSERTEFEFLENREIAKHGAIRIIIKRKEGEVRKDENKDKIFKGGKNNERKDGICRRFFCRG